MWETLSGAGFGEERESEGENPLEYSVVGKKEALGKTQSEGRGVGGRRRR